MKAVPMHHPVSTLVYSSGNRNVEAVMVDGNMVMENSVILGTDEAAMAARGQSTADDLSRRAGTWPLKKRAWRSLAY